MKAIWLLIVSVFTTLATIQAEEPDYTALCRLFPTGTTLRMPGSCEQYIKCDTGKGQVRSCASPKSFDAQKQVCIEAKDSSSLCGNRCEGINGKWVADPTNCHGFFYCEKSVAFPGHCEGNLHFDQSKQMCVYTGSSVCVDVAHICEIAPDKIKFRDENDCSYYYECAKQTHTRKACKNQYFDVEAQKCVDKSQMTCNAHPIPKNICIVSKKPYVGFRADQATCRGYFYCKNLGIVEDLEPVWGQCPFGKFFSEEAKTCLDPVDVKCAFNRCEGREDGLVVSGKNNCHNYLKCVGGFVKEEITCARDYFFHEEFSACIPEILYYPCCDVKVKG